jgi:ribosomal-protein-alanine N-acetyltransferase
VNDGVAVRALTHGDLDAVAQLEEQSFSQPWRRSSFERLIGEPGAVACVAVTDRGRVIGYGVLLAAADEGEVITLAVEPDVRGQGIGARLLDELLERGAQLGVARVFLDVRSSNAPAQALYASRGFREMGRRTDYYAAPREDARVLALDLNRIEGVQP